MEIPVAREQEGMMLAGPPVGRLREEVEEERAVLVVPLVWHPRSLFFRFSLAE